MIDENKLIEEIRKMFKPLTTADGSSYIDELIQAHNETLYDVLKTIEEQPKVNEWIPVEERLSDENVNVLVTHYINKKTKIVSEAFLYEDEWWFASDGTKIERKVTAWMPLPEKYEKE